MTPPDGLNAVSDEAARRALYDLLHGRPTRKQAIERVVEVGAAYLELDHGHITSIDPEADRWEVIGSTDDEDGPYPEGLTARLSDAYCRRTFQQQAPLALDDAGNQGWAEEHAYELHQLDTYLGIRIDVLGEPYGTICFVDSAARDRPFSEAEQIFIELAGQVLQKVLEETYHGQDIANRDRLISVLNRVLRHNLRNDLNVVQGNAQLLIDRTSGEEAEWAATIEAKAAHLVSLAEKARSLETFTRTVPVSQPIDVVPLVRERVAEHRVAYPEIDCSLETPERAMAFAAPQLAGALDELLENAARHTGDDPSIAVAVRRGEDLVTVAVEDDGPGLPAGERRILTGELETPLDHGSGLGLALVYWTVSNLDGNLEVTSTPSGTAIEIQLTRPD